MTVLFVTHAAYLDHDPGRGHPERPQRLTAVEAGVVDAGLEGEVVFAPPREATPAEIERVHAPAYVAALERFCRAGGGQLDLDTAVAPGSWEAALMAAGAGLEAADRLRAGDADAAFCAVRPPGHHALPTRAMGFCLFNNVAVTAAALADAGERVLIVDIDAHHGNGTQDMFYDDPRVAYVSFHQNPLWPGTGQLTETGTGEGRGRNLNVPLPPGATGNLYRRGIEDLVAPLAATLRPTWLIVSAGFDGHRNDPLTDLGLSAGDFGDIVADLLELVPPGRRLVFLEGGYDLDALRAGTAATMSALVGERVHPERPTAGGPGEEVLLAAARVQRRAFEGDGATTGGTANGGTPGEADGDAAGDPAVRAR
ncbi:MAG TPA: histone deacetylase [Acidimicrobiales bacterium]